MGMYGYVILKTLVCSFLVTVVQSVRFSALEVDLRFGFNGLIYGGEAARDISSLPLGATICISTR